MGESPYLFVYGTLRRGAAADLSRFLAGAATRIGNGRTRGMLFRLDGYPGMIGSPEESDEVLGEIYHIDDPSRAWPILDDYEGSEFKRRIIPVRTDDGKILQAWAYFYCLDTSEKIRIPSGDYLRDA